MNKDNNVWFRCALFTAIVFCLMIKCVIWKMQFFTEARVPILGCFVSCLLLASGVLISKRRPWWMLVVFVAVDMWLFANYAYERAWGQMLSMDMIRMAGNLRGFENSVLAYLHPKMLLWLLLPDVLALVVLLYWRRMENRSWQGWLCVLGICILMVPVQQMSYYRQVLPSRIGYNNHTGFAAWWYIHEPLFNPYVWPKDAARSAFMTQESQDWARPYVYNHGILSFGPALCAFDATYRHWERTLSEENLELTHQEKQKMKLITDDESDFQPQRSLVFILVESLESWAIDYPMQGGFVMPNLHDFIHSHHIYYSPRMYNQLGYGGSSDGQMIALTGMLPVRQGVSVALYGDQPFPNYCHYFPYSITLNPSPGIWKQDIVNPNYGIQILEESDSIRDDEGLFRRLNTLDFTQPTFVLLITISSHVPFLKGEDVDLPLDDNMPGNMAKYLKCLHYMDEQLGTFLSRIDTDPTLSQADVVITGDHIIFYSQDWEQMKAYAEANNISCLGQGWNTTPFLIYSPAFTHSVFEERDTYQMDIYPTVLHLIGCTKPAWKGFGLDLLGDSLRLFGSDDARTLSDKLIRSRYFSKHVYNQKEQ